MSLSSSPVAALWEACSAAISSVSGTAQSEDWGLWAEHLMLPVARYLWLFPEAVKSGERLTAAQEGER